MPTPSSAGSPRSRKSGAEPRLGPDAKAQLSLRYAGGKPVEVSCLVLSTQHLDEEHGLGRRARDGRALHPRGAARGLADRRDTVWHVNPTGKFVIGGPDGDAGLTGRKIIVDTYGGAAPHGGGAFSGKDPTKVDRSAAYAARYLAKNVVAAGLAKRCVLQLSYAIGVARPLSIYVDTFGTGEVAEAEIEKAVAEVMDLTPRGHPHPPRAQPADLPAHLGLRPLRPGARQRGRLLLGADRPDRGAAPRRSDRRGRWPTRDGGRREPRRGATSTAGGTARS